AHLGDAAAKRPTSDGAPDQELQERIFEGEEGFANHLQRGRQMLRCALVREFLYWPRADDNLTVLCVPLVDWPAELNVQVRGLQLCQVERSRAVDFIEP